MGIKIKVRSELYDCDLELERRVTHIVGHSGKGKTGLIDIIEEFNNESEGISINVNPNYNLYTVNTILSLEQLYAFKNTIIFLDDSLMSEKKWFDYSVAKELINIDSYLVVISRDLNLENRVALNFSVNSLLEFKCDGRYHWTEKVCEKLNSNIGIIDCVIVEDKYGIQDIASRVFNVPIVSSEGNGNIYRSIKKEAEKGYRNIFVFFDTANFGYEYKSLINKLKNLPSNIHLYYDSSYECLEYMLLVSNFFKSEFKFDVDKANSFVTWEQYFESELELISRRYPMCKYTHGKNVRKCYYRDCDTTCIEQKKVKCEKFIKGDKIVGMFKNTIFSYLLDVYRRNNNA